MATIRDLYEQSHHLLCSTQSNGVRGCQLHGGCNVGAVPVLDDTKLVGIFSAARYHAASVVTEGRRPADHAHRRGDEYRCAKP